MGAFPRGHFPRPGWSRGTVVHIHCPHVTQLAGNLGKLQVDLGHPSVAWRAAGMTKEAQHERWGWLMCCNHN